MKVSDYVVSFLKNQGISCVFEMSGGMITHLLDSFYRDGRIQVISVHHEQAAAFAADAYGRITGIPGIALATSGPGATNLITGIGSSYFDSSPTIFITGQVNRNEIKGNRRIRQLGFQETDIISIVKSITKGAWQIQSPEEIPSVLKKAFLLARENRPGPVLIDIPMDIQKSDIIISDITEQNESSIENPYTRRYFDEFLQHLEKSKRPLILAGGGIRSSSSIELFRNFVHKINIPVVYSLMGVDVLPYNDPLRIGMIGSYGNRWANLAIAKSDLLLVLGSRLDVRQTGSQTELFRKDKIIFHIDSDSDETNNRIIGCKVLVSNLRDFFTAVIDASDKKKIVIVNNWIKEICVLRETWPDIMELKNAIGINPNVFMHKLSQYCINASSYVTDVGQHQMWAAQSLEIGTGQRFLTSGGMGSMGFGLPASIGACFATGIKPVVMIAGDGGFQSNIQELQTVIRNKLPLKIIILDNGCHGMVRQFQESLFDGRYQSTLWGYSAPNFAEVAKSYGIDSKTISETDEIDNALNWLWLEPSKPALLHVKINTFTNVYPKISFGKPNTEMESNFENIKNNNPVKS